MSQSNGIDVIAYRDLKKLHTPQAFPSWFRRIVIKFCDRIARKKKHSTIPFEKIAEPADNSKSPAEIVQKKEDQDAVLDSIKALPENERMKDSDIETKTAEFILQAREQDKKAADHLERALEKW